MFDPDGRLTKAQTDYIWNNSGQGVTSWSFNNDGSPKLNSFNYMNDSDSQSLIKSFYAAASGTGSSSILYFTGTASQTSYLIGQNLYGEGNFGTGHLLKIINEMSSNIVDYISKDWYSIAGKGNWFFGTGATLSGFAGIVQSEDMYAQGIRRGLAGNYQLTGRNLSQFGKMPMTNASRPIIGLSKWGARLSRVSFGAGLVMYGIGVFNYRNNPNSPNAVHPAKAGLNTVMGYIGLKGGAYGAIISTLYFGVDAFYPGGWVGASETATRTEVYEQQMTGHPFFSNSAIKF